MSYLRQRFALLKQRSFLFYVLSCTISTFGTGLSYVAMSWIALSFHNSVNSVAILMICFWLPNIFFGPFFGVYVDRYSRRGIVIFANAMRGLLLIGFGSFLFVGHSIYLLYALGLISGVFFSLYLPATLTLVREIVPRDKLLYANATIDMAYEVGNVIGMGSAGFFIAWFNAQTALIINGVLFLVSVLFIFSVKPTQHLEVSEETKHFWHELKEGLNYIKHHRQLLIVYLVQLLIVAAFMATPIILAPFAKDILHASVGQFGSIEACLSLGVIIGGVFMPNIAHHFGMARTLAVMCFGLAACFIFFSLNYNIYIAETLYFVIGFTLATWPLIITQAQHLTPFEYQGRVQSSFNALMGITVLLSYLIVDIGSRFVALQWLYIFEIILAVLAGVMSYWYRDIFKTQR